MRTKQAGGDSSRARAREIEQSRGPPGLHAPKVGVLCEAIATCVPVFREQRLSGTRQGRPQGGISCSQLYKWSRLAAFNGLFISSPKAGCGARRSRCRCRSSFRNSAAPASPTAEKILAAARRAIRAQQAGQPGRDGRQRHGPHDRRADRPGQARSPIARRRARWTCSSRPASRSRVALMAMAIQALGDKAVSLTGGQIGIVTDSIAHQGPHPQRSRPSGCSKLPRRRQDRHRRRLPGRRRGLQHHHARPRRQRHDGRRPGRRAPGRRVRDLHRRRRRLHDRPADRPRGPQDRPRSATTRCSSWPASAPA